MTAITIHPRGEQEGVGEDRLARSHMAVRNKVQDYQRQLDQAIVAAKAAGNTERVKALQEALAAMQDIADTL